MAPPARALKGLRILIADDDLDCLEAVALLLEMNGAEVCRCRDGPEALNLVPAFRPDVLISDLAMPLMDGFELIAAIRALPIEKGGMTPAIAFSSLEEGLVRSLALDLGFQEFIRKPADVDLLRVVAELAWPGPRKAARPSRPELVPVGPGTPTTRS